MKISNTNSIIQEILKEMKTEGKGSRKSTSHGRPQSILLQKVSTDHQDGSSSSSRSGSVKSDKQIKLEQERQKLEREKAEFEEWKKRFLN